MKSLVIFDLDGTLLNTIYDLGEACNFALRKMGFAQHPIPAYNYMVGNGVRKLLERAQPDATPQVVDELLKYFREFYDDHCTEDTKPYKGIPELLQELTYRKINIAVASNKYQCDHKQNCGDLLSGYTICSVKGQIPERPTKPDPSIVFDILAEFPTPKSEVLYVGDSGVDMETPGRACIESVGVTWGFRPVTELREAHADNIVSDPSEILNYLTDMF